MPGKTTIYSAANLVVMVDGLRVVGLWDGDDAVQVAPGADYGAGLVGADGEAIFSQSVNKSAAITLRLMHTSAMHRRLTQRAIQQRQGRLNGMRFSVMDTRSGEGGASDQVFIQTAPTDQKGVAAGPREWVLWTGNYEPNVPNAA
jgi:hypothetical protein